MRAHCIRREKTNFLEAAHGLRGARLGTVAERKIEYEKTIVICGVGIRTWRGISTAADGLADPDPGASVQRGNGSVDEVE